jgi:PAS domain S-box-containing protein
MPEPVSTDGLIAEILSAGRSAGGVEELLEIAGQKMRALLPVDDAKLRSTYQSKTGISALEEFVINTGKPYIDNRLSDYSAFQELVRYFNAGFRSCALIPAFFGGRNVLVLTLLSRREDGFVGAVLERAAMVSDVIGCQVVAEVEMRRSLDLANYFDAAFNTVAAQFLLDKSGTIVRANKSALGVLGKTQREISDRKIGELFGIDAETIEGLAKGRSAEISDRRSEGRTYRASAARVNDKLTLLSAYDVSDLKMLGEEARLLECSPHDVFMLLDGDSKIIWVSDNVNRILKMRKETVLGSRLSDLADGGKELFGIIKASPDSYATPLRISIGNDVFADVKSLFIKNSFGGLSCVLTENNLEKYVGNMQRTIEELVEHTGDAVITVDPFGYVKGMNRSAEKLLGYAKGELNGSAVQLLYSDQESQEKLSASLSLARNNEIVENVLVNLRAKDSEEAVPCEQAIRSMVDAENGLVGYMIMTKELATRLENERLKEDLEDSMREFEKAKGESELKTQFINNISHDLKTPLTNIKGFSKLFLEGTFGALTDEQKEYITIIGTEADRLMELIMQILEVAKLESGKIKLDQQQVNLAELAKTPSLKTLVEVAHSKGLEFGDWSIDYDVPEIRADPNRLIQVFANLIGNALKFTEKGSIKVRISRKGRTSVMIEVIDTGIGISKEDKTKLFKKFFQIQRKDLKKQEGSGTGLGLSIAKEIVNLHGGRMSVNSEPGKGSTFWFTLPIAGKKKKKESEAAKQ